MGGSARERSGKGADADVAPGDDIDDDDRQTVTDEDTGQPAVAWARTDRWALARHDATVGGSAPVPSA